MAGRRTGSSAGFPARDRLRLTDVQGVTRRSCREPRTWWPGPPTGPGWPVASAWRSAGTGTPHAGRIGCAAARAPGAGATRDPDPGERRAPGTGSGTVLPVSCLAPPAEPGWDDGRMTGERLEVQRMIEADPAAIFRVLCDPQGHVAIDSSGMLMDATGAPVTAVGDTFVVHMDREALNDYPLGRYDVTVTITALVPDREIAWTVVGQIRPVIGHVYGYRLEAAGDRGHAGHLVLRLVHDRPALAGGRHLPGHLRGRAAGHARDPGPDGRPGISRRPDLTPGGPRGLQCLRRPAMDRLRAGPPVLPAPVTAQLTDSEVPCTCSI